MANQGLVRSSSSSSTSRDVLRPLKELMSCFTCCLPRRSSRRHNRSSEDNIDTGEDVSDEECSSPKPVYLRFVNCTSEPVAVYWRDDRGEEMRYFDLNPECSISQQTYKGNEWVVRDRATEAVIVRARSSDVMRQVCNIVAPRGPKAHTTDSWRLVPTESDTPIPSCYTQTVESRTGIAVVGTGGVQAEALRMAACVVDRMLEGSPSELVRELQAHLCKVALIPHDKVTTDILEHSHLKGTACPDGRDWDTETRGLGGTRVEPTCSVGEENVLRCRKDRYRKESILVHEFAHTVMEVGFSTASRSRIEAIYEASKGRYKEGCYMIVNAQEYWAEGSESWFNATVRDDVNGGVKTRERLKEHDPELATMLEEIYGDGDWRFEGDWTGSADDCRCPLCVRKPGESKEGSPSSPGHKTLTKRQRLLDEKLSLD